MFSSRVPAFGTGQNNHDPDLSPSPPASSSLVKLPVDINDLDPSDNELSTQETLEQSFRNVSLDPGRPHFFGKSSSFMFLQKAMDIRQGYVEESAATREPTPEQAGAPGKRKEFWNSHPVSPCLHVHLLITLKFH